MQVSDAGRLLSIWVRSADGVPLGRIGTVYIPDGSVQPLLVTFPADAEFPRVAPLFGAELETDALVLGYSAELIDGGPAVEADVPLSTGEIAAVLGYYGRRVDLVGPITERIEGTGDVAAGFADVRAVPRLPGIGDEDLPPIVITRPAQSG
jgi:hypothetical protein